MAGRVVPRSEAAKLEGAGCTIHVRVRAEQTGGTFGMIEMEVAPSFRAPPMPHAHSREDWWGAVLEGEIAIELDGREVRAAAGDVVFVPRGTMFRWWNAKDEPARWTCTYAPGGFEGYFFEIGEALRSGKSLPEAAPPLWTKFGLTHRPA